METIQILGDNRFETHTKFRTACRGVIVENGNILLTYETNRDQWFIPGGGQEAGESLKECCVRELAEETGYAVEPLDPFLVIHEYYEEWLYSSYYFPCRVTGQTQRRLTERERAAGLEPRWIPFKDALAIFSRHREYAYDEMKRGAYLREYKALLSYGGANDTDSLSGQPALQNL